jgi:hypothetical protein
MAPLKQTPCHLEDPSSSFAPARDPPRRDPSARTFLSRTRPTPAKIIEAAVAAGLPAAPLWSIVGGDSPIDLDRQILATDHYTLWETIMRRLRIARVPDRLCAADLHRSLRRARLRRLSVLKWESV